VASSDEKNREEPRGCNVCDMRTTDEKRLELAANLEGVFRSVGAVIESAQALGIAQHGYQGTGPHETELSRDLSAALFVARRALQAGCAFLKYDEAHWPEIREEMRKAQNILRGGRPDSVSGPDQMMAVDVARQAIMMSLGIGFPASGAMEAVKFIRQTYVELFGSVFEKAPSDITIRSHLDETSTVGQIVSKQVAPGIVSGLQFNELTGPALDLAADMLWAGYEEAGAKPPEAVLRFSFADGDKTRRSLRTRLEMSVSRDVRESRPPSK